MSDEWKILWEAQKHELQARAAKMHQAWQGFVGLLTEWLRYSR